MNKNTNTFSRQERMSLLKASDAFDWLTIKQLSVLVWWELFNVSRINVFYNSLDAGKAAIFAYKDAANFKG
jgi:hypothetical protein